MYFIYCHLNFPAKLVRPWRCPLNTIGNLNYDMFIVRVNVYNIAVELFNVKPLTI